MGHFGGVASPDSGVESAPPVAWRAGVAMNQAWSACRTRRGAACPPAAQLPSVLELARHGGHLVEAGAHGRGLAEPFRELDEWLTGYRSLWEARLDRFGAALETRHQTRSHTKRERRP